MRILPLPPEGVKLSAQSVGQEYLQSFTNTGHLKVWVIRLYRETDILKFSIASS